jgi:hypothetical protein
MRREAMSPSATIRDRLRDDAMRETTESLIQEISMTLISRLATRPRAIVLTGSFARGEGSTLTVANRLRVLGDMEFMVVFLRGVDRGLLQMALDQEARQIRGELAVRGIECELEFRAITPDYFQVLRPQIFGYELLSCGRTVWGDRSVLASVPRFPASAIPRWDAWRMLNNRILEQLEWVDAIANGTRDELLRMFYQLVKCHLDLGTTLLVFGGRYEDTYAGRSAALLRWAAEAESSSKVEFLGRVAGRVAACTSFKLLPNTDSVLLDVRLNDEDIETFRSDLSRAVIELVPLAREIWRWEAGELTRCGSGHAPSDDALHRAVLRQQPLSEKLRGWAKLTFMPAVRSERGFFARLPRLLLRGSPRYLVYRVAGDLYFQLPSVLSGKIADSSLAALDRLLPVTFAGNRVESREWWRLRANVLKSWRLFLRNHWA